MHYLVTCGDERGCLGIFHQLRAAKYSAERQGGFIEKWDGERQLATWVRRDGQWVIGGVLPAKERM